MLIKLIVGLRNPGSEYKNTRHNAGAWLVEQFATESRTSFKKEKKLHAELASFPDNSCKLALPTTFMNQSGLPVREITQFYRIKPEEIVVVHDELDLPCGRIKLKKGGGHGGHNGLRDIITSLGSNDFYRLRIGIGHPGHKDLVHNYVLGQPQQKDRQFILSSISRTFESLPLLFEGKITIATNQINS